MMPNEHHSSINNFIESSHGIYRVDWHVDLHRKIITCLLTALIWFVQLQLVKTLEVYGQHEPFFNVFSSSFSSRYVAVSRHQGSIE